MSTSALKNRRPGRWLVLVLAICIGVLALLTIQGCRGLCQKWYPCPPKEHLVVVFNNGNEVCAAPAKTVAKRGESVLFINATQTTVTITAPVTYQVWAPPVDPHTITLAPLAIMKVQVSDQALLRQGFTFNIPAIQSCSGLPGPGMDIDG